MVGARYLSCPFGCPRGECLVDFRSLVEGNFLQIFDKRADAQAGFFPGCVYLVSCWYTRYETNSRMAVFYLTSMVISGTSILVPKKSVSSYQSLTFSGFSNILGYGFSLIAPAGGIAAWSWGEPYIF